MRRILTLFGAALLMAGCSVYRPYVRPAVQADGLYGPGVVQGDTASIATLHWSELFTDPDLQALIRIGLENNTDLAVARLRVEQAEATLMASRLAYLPSATLSPQGQLSSFDGSKPAKTYNIGRRPSGSSTYSGASQTPSVGPRRRCCRAMPTARRCRRRSFRP